MSNKYMDKSPFKGKSLLSFPDNYIIVDIETTGLNTKYDEIVEIGAIKINSNVVVETFNSLIKTNRKISNFLTQLSGITNEMLVDAPLSQKVIRDFSDFIGNEILIGYNIVFDINFLYDSFQLHLNQHLSNDFIDLLHFSRKLLPDLQNHKLITVANYFNINIENCHRALKDCEITQECYKQLKSLISDDKDFQKIFNSNKKSHLDAKNIKPNTNEFDKDNYFYNKYCCFTGALTIPREEAMQLVADKGGICQNGVTKATNYLILGDLDYCASLKGDKSAKQKKAESLKLKGQDIEIITESVFYELLNNEN